MRVFALFLTSAAFFGVSECLNNCTCGDSSCTCKWPRISVGDKVCLLPADGLECIPVNPTDLSDHQPRYTSTDVGCTCSTELCTCMLKEVTEKDEICLNTSDGMLCNDVEIKGTIGNRTRRSTEHHACTCHADECDCDLKKARGAQKICFDTARIRSCAPVQKLARSHSRAYTAEELLRICRCDGINCRCRYPKGSLHSRNREQICVQSSPGSDCVPLLGSADAVSERILSSGRSGASGRITANYDCRCEGNKCSCQFTKIFGTEEICLKEDTTTNCAPITELNSKSGRTYNFGDLQKYCMCEGNACTCIYPERSKNHGQRDICIRLSAEENCVSIKTSGFGPASSGRSSSSPCTCSEEQCSCNFTGNEQICLETDKGRSCVPVSTLMDPLATEEDEGFFRNCEIESDNVHCYLPSDAEALQICVLSPSGDDCTPILKIGPSFNDFGTRYEEYCMCEAGKCTCHFPKFHGSGKICLHTVKDIICVNFTLYAENVNLTFVAPNPGDECACQKTLCLCYMKEARHSDQMCIYTVDGIQCVPIFVDLRNRSPRMEEDETPDQLRHYARRRHFECYDGLCVCDIVSRSERAKSISDICIRQSGSSECVPAVHQSRGRVSCGCNEGKGYCICDWKEVENGDEICVKLSSALECGPVPKKPSSVRKSSLDSDCTCYLLIFCFCGFELEINLRALDHTSTNICVTSNTGETCKPAEKMADLSAVGGVYCPLRDGYYKCVWDKSENVTEICLKTYGKETCKVPSYKVEQADIECHYDLCIAAIGDRSWRLRSITDICVRQSGNSECVPAVQQSQGRVSCSCNDDKGSCICDWKKVENGDEMCVKLRNGMECKPVRKNAISHRIKEFGFECGCWALVFCACWPVIQFRTKAPGRSSTTICVSSDTGKTCKPGEEMADILAINGVYCPLKDGYYKCVWGKSENVNKICWTTDGKETCRTPTDNLQEPDVECYEDVCIGAIGSQSERSISSKSITDICVKQSGSSECVPAPKQSRGRVSCGCNEETGSCICDWKEVENGDEICVKLPNGMECEPVHKNAASLGLKELGIDCACFPLIFCACGSEVTLRNRASDGASTAICVSSSTDKTCKPAEEMADISASSGVYCPLKDGYSICVWKKSANVKEICWKTGKKDTCRKPAVEVP